MVYIDVGTTYMSTFTVMESAAKCGDNTMDMAGMGCGNFFGTGTGAGSDFTGSTEDAAPSDVTLPNGEAVKYHMSWSLHLIQP